MIIIIIITVILITAFVLLDSFNFLPQRVYTSSDLGIDTILSQTDYDGDGIDDYRDIMLGARIDAENKPKYDGAYFQGGYPPGEIGVCTDVIWRAFKNAGYSLKDMIDSDISNNPEDYPAAQKPDPNIDFRRVRNLRVFFDKYAVSLTTDPSAVTEWQAGDVIIFGDNDHIGIVSDKRSKNGRVWIIHNGGQIKREEDYLKRALISAHYRFDAIKIPSSVLSAWNGEHN
ncbi:MAG: DUF1287 domain-containing protein [Clostridiales bacterium]|nr:MAG: DUF1287 domain-containing protein [Clostridiales bacterium]